MIDKKIQSLIMDQVKDLMIPAENVAYVFDFNSLYHALLVLTQVAYTMIPVVNKEGKICGLESTNQIIQASITTDQIDFKMIEQLTLNQIELRQAEYVTLQDNLETILHKLMTNNFLCVVDSKDQQGFIGIITRNALLKRINAFLHSNLVNDWLKNQEDLPSLDEPLKTIPKD